MKLVTTWVARSMDLTPTQRHPRPAPRASRRRCSGDRRAPTDPQHEGEDDDEDDEGDDEEDDDEDGEDDDDDEASRIHDVVRNV